MLTPNDGSTEGGVTQYDCGARRRVLFDSLRVAVESGSRDIRLLRDVLPRCGVDFMPYRDAEFFNNTTRQAYFDATSAGMRFSLATHEGHRPWKRVRGLAGRKNAATSSCFLRCCYLPSKRDCRAVASDHCASNRSVANERNCYFVKAATPTLPGTCAPTSNDPSPGDAVAAALVAKVRS
jgi:hypothetical protein